MWFSSASLMPFFSAIFTASENWRDSFSIIGPCGSWRNMRLAPTTRMTFAPMASA